MTGSLLWALASLVLLSVPGLATPARTPWLILVAAAGFASSVGGRGRLPASGLEPRLGTLAAVSATGVGLVWSATRSGLGAVVAVIGLGVAVVALARVRSERARLVAVALVAVAGCLAVASPTGIDVQHLHEAAGQALADGHSPFRGLGVDDGSPYEPADAVIDGYPYPPVAMLAYARLGTAAGDPRLISVGAWAVTAALMLYELRDRIRAWSRAAAATVVASVAPFWTVHLAYTEPLSLLLFTLTWSAWSRPVLAGLLLGAALTSKQYLIGAVPAVVWALRRDPPRLAAAAAGAAAVNVPLLAWDLGDAWRSLVTFHLDRAVRPDGSSLVSVAAHHGIDLSVPAVVLVLAAVGASLAVARRAADPRRAVFGAIATALLVTFALGSQAFPNYWFLLSGVVLLWALSSPAPVSVATGGHGVNRSARFPRQGRQEHLAGVHAE